MSGANQPGSPTVAERWPPTTASIYPVDIVRKLSALTSEFYGHEAASFSATRQTPWHGWDEAWRIIVEESPELTAKPLIALDLGCGNLRFERFLSERVREPVAVHALDNCAALPKDELDAPLLSDHLDVAFREIDLVEHLLDSPDIPLVNPGTCNIAVAFGLMHHLPTFALRVRIIQELIGALRPGGFAIASFWQFLNDPRIAAKAAAITVEGRAARHLPPFGPGDHLLGWQHAQDVYRFCHHTTDSEIDKLLTHAREEATRADPESLTFREVARFSADGKEGNLNRYVVLQRRGPQADALC